MGFVEVGAAMDSTIYTIICGYAVTNPFVASRRYLSVLPKGL
jgi:hypothetical protein